MPDRHGKTEKRRRDREQHRHNSEWKDKEDNDNWKNPVDWSLIDDDDDDDIDEYLSDDYHTSNKPIAKQNRPHITTHTHLHNIQTQSSSKLLKIQSNVSKQNNEYYFEDRQLPNRIFNIFSNIKSRLEVMKTLKHTEDEEDRYCQPKYEYGNRTTSKILNSFPRQPIIEHFKQVGYTNFDKEDGKQILKYLQKPILRRSQYGILLFNSERQIFVVQNHDGIWKAPSGHRRINNSFQFETIIETVSRVFNQQICTKHQLTDEIFQFYDLQDNQHFDSHKYIEKQFNNNTENTYTTLIGLFISQFDDPIIEFELRDTYENQACQWLPIDDIIKHKPNDDQCDIYYTIRSFVEYIESQILDLIRNTQYNIKSNDDIQQISIENDIIVTTATLDINIVKPNKPLSISDKVFHRAQQCIEFEYNFKETLDTNLSNILINNYAPKTLASFNLTLNLPNDHTNILKYEQCVLQKLQIPYYNQPELDSKFPRRVGNTIISQPKQTSILPLLIVAKRNYIDIHEYDIISERNSFRKIAMNNENYVVGIQRIGKTLFLRRHDHRIINRNDVGFRFEKMSIRNYNHNLCFKQLVQGHIGTFKTLITAETDAIHQQTQQVIELKSRWNRIDINHPDDCNVKTVIVGQHTGAETPILTDIQEYDVSNIIYDEIKNTIFIFLYRVLDFLQKNVMQDGIYLLSRRYDPNVGKHNLYLYKVAKQDQQNLTFITQEMLNQLAFNV